MTIDAVVDTYVAVAQEVYDSWDQVDGADELFGTGGICDAIADQVVSELATMGVDAWTTPGDNHTWVEVDLGEGMYGFDIPAYVYERGSGYVWEKLEGVQFNRSDVAHWQLDALLSAQRREDMEYA